MFIVVLSFFTLHPGTQVLESLIWEEKYYNLDCSSQYDVKLL